MFSNLCIFNIQFLHVFFFLQFLYILNWACTLKICIIQSATASHVVLNHEWIKFKHSVRCVFMLWSEIYSLCLASKFDLFLPLKYYLHKVVVSKRCFCSCYYLHSKYKQDYEVCVTRVSFETLICMHLYHIGCLLVCSCTH